jgi:hypothetical protein
MLRHFVQGAFVTTDRNRELLRSELLQLIEKQVDALKDKRFLDFTAEERREYDHRQTRIHDLLIALHYADPAA